jgi:hypothetical protein
MQHAYSMHPWGGLPLTHLLHVLFQDPVLVLGHD